ncbi:MAG TPA: type II secretion system F family protein [Xanthobacteraceae bacterium]|nr:type II secretion system F family protein [Xanthobacteraceae bacterium]
MDVQLLSIVLLATFCAGAIAWVLIYPYLSGENEAEKRMQSVARAGAPGVKSASRAVKSRREQVESSLKEIENRNKQKKSPPLSTRLAQAGVVWTKQHFVIGSAILGFVVAAIVFILDVGPFAALAAGFAAGVGLPRWTLSYLKRRRERLFIERFPDAIDVVVRGIKSGLPLGDSLRIISTESPEPIRSEFRHILETQAIGVPLGEACGKLFDRMPLAEANFFAIVIAIQQRSGGNLSEALGNLSKVLRERKKMKGKIKAMSTEATASAAIIGALPIAVMAVVYLTSPDYITLLWTNRMGQMMLAGSAVWMSIGIFVMKKMINFDF